MFAVLLREFNVSWMLIFILTFLTISCLLWIRRYQIPSYRQPPGPFSWPLVGALPNVAVSLLRSGKRLPVYLKHLSRQYGQIFTVKLGGTSFIILNDYNSIKEAFQHPNLCDRPNNNLDMKSLLGGEGVGTSSGELWKRQRRFTLTTFRNLGLGKSSFEDIMTAESPELIKEINRYGESPFDPKILFPNATANVVCSFAFGKRYDYTDADFKFLLGTINQIEQRIREVAGLQLLLPIFKYIPTKRRSQLEANVVTLGKFISNIVNEHIANFDPDHVQDYIDIFINEIESSKDQLLTTGNLLGTVTGLFFAGSGTTSMTMRWAMYCMLKYPDVQMNVQKELDDVIGQNRMPAMSDRTSLPYTMATLLEIQRFGSTASFGPMHLASCDTEICGHLISKGSHLLSNLWAVHHDPHIWTNPEDFDPHHFLDKDGKVNQPKEFIPFNIGRRVCLGASLAKIQLFIFFTHLLHRFTFVFPDGISSLPDVSGAQPIPDFLVKAVYRH